jgi:hypothetical protein
MESFSLYPIALSFSSTDIVDRFGCLKTFSPNVCKTATRLF